MERYYEGSHVLVLESTAQSMSLQICISFFTIYFRGVVRGGQKGLKPPFKY